jgi:hypothetical protein
MNSLFSNQMMPACGCPKAAVTNWLHTRKIAGSLAVGESF